MNEVISQNEDWGFYGTSKGFTQDQGSTFNLTAHAIAKALDLDPQFVRPFLDSRLGRHFADEVSNHTASGKGVEVSVHKAIATWIRYALPFKAKGSGCESYLKYEVVRFSV